MSQAPNRNALIVVIIVALAVGVGALLIIRAAGNRAEGPPPGRVEGIAPAPTVENVPPAEATATAEAPPPPAAVSAEPGPAAPVMPGHTETLALSPEGARPTDAVTVTMTFEGKPGEEGAVTVTATLAAGLKWNDAAPEPSVKLDAPDWLAPREAFARVTEGAAAGQAVFTAAAVMKPAGDAPGTLHLTVYPCRLDGSQCLVVDQNVRRRTPRRALNPPLSRRPPHSAGPHRTGLSHGAAGQSPCRLRALVP